MAKNFRSRKINVKGFGSSFNIFIFIPLTKEKFAIDDIQLNTKVIEIKKRLELLTGIPMNLQRLFYLDKEDLVDDSDLRSNDVVMSAILNLHIWSRWQKVVFNSFIGNETEILKTKEANVDGKFNVSGEFYQNLLNISLFVSANKGRRELMETLINKGANVNWATNLGRTALHAAAARGQIKCIDLLLEHGANADLIDFVGKTPAMVANDYGHRASEKQLFLFQWQKRADCLTLDQNTVNLMMHQQFDSGYCTWLKGKAQQIYMCNTLPSGEFVGTSIDAPKQKSKVKHEFQEISGEDSSIEAKEHSYSLSLPRLSDSPMSLGTTNQRKESYQHWLTRKKTEARTKLTADQNDERGNGRSGKYNEKEQKSRLKRSVKKSPMPTEKLKKKVEVYNDFDDFVPVFEQGCLRNMEPQY